MSLILKKLMGVGVGRPLAGRPSVGVTRWMCSNRSPDKPADQNWPLKDAPKWAQAWWPEQMKRLDEACDKLERPKILDERDDEQLSELVKSELNRKVLRYRFLCAAGRVRFEIKELQKTPEYKELVVTLARTVQDLANGWAAMRAKGLPDLTIPKTIKDTIVGWPKRIEMPKLFAPKGPKMTKSGTKKKTPKAEKKL